MCSSLGLRYWRTLRWFHNWSSRQCRLYLSVQPILLCKYIPLLGKKLKRWSKRSTIRMRKPSSWSYWWFQALQRGSSPYITMHYPCTPYPNIYHCIFRQQKSWSPKCHVRWNKLQHQCLECLCCLQHYFVSK